MGKAIAPCQLLETTGGGSFPLKSPVCHSNPLTRAEGSSSYSRSASRLRADTSKGWFELNTAFYYSGQSGATSKGPMNFPQVFEQVYQMDAFANCIINDEPSRVPGEMGLRDMKILMGIYEAAETGKPVTFNWK